MSADESPWRPIAPRARTRSARSVGGDAGDRLLAAEADLDRRVRRILTRRSWPASVRALMAANAIYHHYYRWARLYEQA